MRFLTFIFLLILGLVAGYYLSSWERAAVDSHLLGFPDANPALHNLRPWALFALCLLPALGAFWYNLASILDRYLFRKTLVAYLITTTALVSLYLLMDVQDSLSELKEAKNPATFLPLYYGVTLSQVLVMLSPFTILLSLLFALGQLSSSREIVAFTQTGRGILRLLLPLVVLGGLISFANFLLSYHVAPWAEGYREALLESAKRGSTSQATNVIYKNPEDRRLWFIGRFPYNFADGEPLRDVEVVTVNADETLHDRLFSPSVVWDRESGVWTFANPRRLLVQDTPTPGFEEGLPESLIHEDWPETPAIILQQSAKGLDARYLGIPGLHDWLSAHPDRSTFLSRSFETQFHYRWAQPWLCLVTVLLAAPLGIAFSRRGPGGGVVVAIVLIGLMFFFSEVFLAFGDSGNLPAIPAAWATNGIFFLIALFLIHRRFSGRPIFQTIAKVFGS